MYRAPIYNGVFLEIVFTFNPMYNDTSIDIPHRDNKSIETVQRYTFTDNWIEWCKCLQGQYEFDLKFCEKYILFDNDADRTLYILTWNAIL